MSCGTSRTTGLRSVPALNTIVVSATSMPPGPASQNAWMGTHGFGSPLAVSLGIRGSRTLTGDSESTSSVPPYLKSPQTSLSLALNVLRGPLLQTHVRRKPWSGNKEREDQLCIKPGCRLGAIIAGQACDVGFWHPDMDDAVGTQVHCLSIMRETGLYPQYARCLALVQVQGITDVWQRVGLVQ